MNVVLCLLVALIYVYVIYRFFFYNEANADDTFDENADDPFAEETLVSETIRIFDEILQTDYAALNLNKLETVKNERNRDKLRSSLKTCSCGNQSSKMYVKDYIKDLLQRRLNVTEETINEIIPFDNPSQLSAQDMFEILLCLYKNKYGYNALEEMIAANGLDKPYGEGLHAHYEITIQDMRELYGRHKRLLANLDFYDKLNIVAQRVYQRSYGLGAIDEIRDMAIDGLNCGTSGIPSTFYMYGADARFGAQKGELPLTSYNAIWVMYRGKLIHFSFMGFQTERELQRVAKLVYRYDSPGTLDASTGYIVNFMQDGSRVSVARPPFCESWAFFIRKLDVASKMSLEDLYPFAGVDKLIQTLKWIVAGKRNIAITGEQFTGKSTLLMSMVQFFSEASPIRVQEMEFELYLRKIYPKRNILTVRETPSVSAQEGIEFAKKTDGRIGLFAEIAQAAVAALAIQMGQVGVSQIIFTHHAKTVKDLVESFRNNMIEVAGYSDEKIVERTVARVLNFDVHLASSITGVRYVERVTELLPNQEEIYPDDMKDATREYFYRSTDRELFKSRDLLVFENGEYVYKAAPSETTIKIIQSALSDTEKQEFAEYLQSIAI